MQLISVIVYLISSKLQSIRAIILFNWLFSVRMDYYLFTLYAILLSICFCF